MEAVLGVVSVVLVAATVVLWRKAEKANAAAQDAQLALVAAETKLEPLLQELDSARDEAASVARDREALQGRIHTAEKNEAVALQKVEAVEIRLREHEQLKTQFEQYAKSAALETGNQLSSKLMEDHMRSREETHNLFKQFTQTASEELLKKQHELAGTMEVLRGRVEQSGNQVNVLVRAMKNPIGAGAEGEIALNNLLQQLGLTPGVDYDLQVHLAGEASDLRPDGVVYLPNDQALIIDAKASQHIFALYEADGTPEFDGVFDRVRATMKNHVRQLATKAYREELKKMLGAKGRNLSRAMLVMFVPNDEIITRLRRKDPELMDMLAKAEIILAGPATLPAVFMYAGTLIREAKQQDEHHAILELTSELMADLITALGHAEDVMKGVRSSATAYDKFAASMNRGVMGRLKRLGAKGVRPAKNKQLPGNLPRYDITKQDEILQGEAEEVGTVLSLPKEDAA